LREVAGLDAGQLKSDISVSLKLNFSEFNALLLNGF
jgi:hypothetical protein